MVLSIGLGVVLIFQLGCARLGSADSAGRAFASEALGLEISLDKTAYRPGEPILATVRLLNLDEAALTLQPLSAHTLTFYAGGEDAEDRLIVEPVFSSREKPSEIVTLESGASLERAFLFTRLTSDEGPFVTTARYGSTVERESALATKKENVHEVARVVAPPTGFSVDGERVFRRDSAGLLMKKEAIDLCQNLHEGEPEELDAVLISNEAGFLDWWVFESQNGATNTDIASEGRAWIVNPYLGLVRIRTGAPPTEISKRDQNFRITHRWAAEEPSEGTE